MSAHFDSPFVVFAIALIAQAVAAYAGDFLRKRAVSFKQGERHDFNTVQAATLTLLALIIGFTFSMAVNRYDQRKALEEAEANAIGTEYLRADLLPPDGRVRARTMLRRYLELRIAFYEQSDEAGIDQQTVQVQDQLWALVALAAASQPTPTTALAISGMNDVLNAQGYTQAAWGNRIPVGAWAMMALMAICCNLLVGYGERRQGELLLFVLPVVVSVSLFLIADIDSPSGGVIRVRPHNLLAIAQIVKAN
ncbi:MULTISPECIES: hypothetical protein [unclassified Bradyrhizobium]|uniref:bestrophin-like domain n=1 Tax=unclassified Bradyrhizobium TaxID=2631580 RepID=UPI0029169FBE|nr:MULTISPECIES: hypothetical protein [unclassified Bradyrhizobium]